MSTIIRRIARIVPMLTYIRPSLTQSMVHRQYPIGARSNRKRPPGSVAPRSPRPVVDVPHSRRTGDEPDSAVAEGVSHRAVKFLAEPRGFGIRPVGGVREEMP